MNAEIKSGKKLNNASGHNKMPGANKKQGWLQRFFNWLNQGTQKALHQQGNCFS